MAQNIMTMCTWTNVQILHRPVYKPTSNWKVWTRHVGAIPTYLELDPDYFQQGKGGNGILRAIHYPPITEDQEIAYVRGNTKTLTITLLMGASAEGLEVLNKQGQWVGITASQAHSS